MNVNDTSHLKVCACVACGKGPKDGVPVKRVTAAGNSYACAGCIMKHGIDALRDDFEKQLGDAVGRPRKTRQCIRCGSWVGPREDGSLPAYCLTCEDQWRKLQREARKDRERRKRRGKPSELDRIDEGRGS